MRSARRRRRTSWSRSSLDRNRRTSGGRSRWGLGGVRSATAGRSHRAPSLTERAYDPHGRHQQQRAQSASTSRSCRRRRNALELYATTRLRLSGSRGPVSVVRRHPCEFCGHEFLKRLSCPSGVFGSVDACPSCGKSPTPPAPSGRTFPLPFKFERVRDQLFEIGEVVPEPLVAPPMRIFEEASVGEITWVSPATVIGVGVGNIEGITKLELSREPEDVVVQEGKAVVNPHILKAYGINVVEHPAVEEDTVYLLYNSDELKKENLKFWKDFDHGELPGVQKVVLGAGLPPSSFAQEYQQEVP